MVFPFGTIGGHSEMNSHCFIIVSTSPPIGLHLELGVANIQKAAKENPADVEFDFLYGLREGSWQISICNRPKWDN
jgi:hypothetical protein